jgi:hypothetical protein
MSLKRNTVYARADDPYCYAKIEFITTDDEEVCLTDERELMIGSIVFKCEDGFVNLEQKEVD